MIDFFPHETIRPIQKELIESVNKAFINKSHLIAHAPTGLGKTAATLAPALKYAIDNDLKVFFLTSRHTQHEIAIETAKKISKKTKITTLSIIGKKWMCSQPGVHNLPSLDFSEYCKSLREKNQCPYHNKTKDKNKYTIEAKKLLEDLITIGPIPAEKIVEYAKELCPYEIALMLAKQAKLIISDYYYIFNESIRNRFFEKAEIDLKKCIIIIDEGHNLPSRLRELQTKRLTLFSLERAQSESKKYHLDLPINHVQKKLLELNNEIETSLNPSTSNFSKNERFVDINEFKLKNEEQIIDALEEGAKEVREHQKSSYIGSIADFILKWDKGGDEYARIINYEYKHKKNIILSKICLDPSIISKEVIEKSHTTILMSGTLNPTSMYKDILGFPDDTIEEEFGSPFPEKNKLSIIIPKTTTKFTQRSDQMFKNIAEICAKVCNEIPGNSAIFFPSYFIRDSVFQFFSTICKKTIFNEAQGMTKEEKQEMLDKFKTYKKVGAVLLGVASGSFGEGVDMPGDLLKGVIIVGLPLEKPNLETKKLIDYYQIKFNQGWNYGYIMPALTKTLQNAGRCIRTEKDRGVLIFLDQRYTWPNYFKCFPNEWNLKISLDYIEKINEFFNITPE